jgi:LysM repeat protein
LSFYLAAGGFFVPITAQAFSISSLLGSEVAASDTAPTISNSQTGLALQPTVLPTLAKDKKGQQVDPTAEVNIVADSALSPTASPKKEGVKGVGGGDFEGDLEIYVVHAGDTVQIVADLFGVTPDTILSANNLTKGQKLTVGDVLLILPFSGVEHTVAKGETLQGLASKYKVDIDDILNANDLETGAKLVIGEKLMIPGGSMSATPSTKPKSGGGSKFTGSSSVPLTAGYFSNPVPGAIKSRGVKPGHKGVDLAAPTGTPIHAAASGTVIIARPGWNGGFGTYVIMQHSNGTKTLYAHMSKLGTTPGAQVSKGDTIGYVGNTGKSTGPHLHFEVMGAKNPF